MTPSQEQRILKHLETARRIAISVAQKKGLNEPRDRELVEDLVGEAYHALVWAVVEENYREDRLGWIVKMRVINAFRKLVRQRRQGLSLDQANGFGKRDATLHNLVRDSAPPAWEKMNERRIKDFVESLAEEEGRIDYSRRHGGYQQPPPTLATTNRETVFKLCVLDGKSLSYVGRQVGMTPKEVQRYLLQMRQKIKSQVLAELGLVRDNQEVA